MCIRDRSSGPLPARSSGPLPCTVLGSVPLAVLGSAPSIADYDVMQAVLGSAPSSADYDVMQAVLGSAPSIADECHAGGSRVRSLKCRLMSCRRFSGPLPQVQTMMSCRRFSGPLPQVQTNVMQTVLGSAPSSADECHAGGSRVRSLSFCTRALAVHRPAAPLEGAGHRGRHGTQ